VNREEGGVGGEGGEGVGTDKRVEERGKREGSKKGQGRKR